MGLGGGREEMLQVTWIPVGERVPITTRTVWIFDGERVHLGYYADATGQWLQVDDDVIDIQESVTHWGELVWPKPPRETL